MNIFSDPPPLISAFWRDPSLIRLGRGKEGRGYLWALLVNNSDQSKLRK
jgi:hypothetical protein